MNKENRTVITVRAEYSDQIIKEYQGNPLIEALPPIWSMEDTEELIYSYPEFYEFERQLDGIYRYHCAQRIYSYFQPLGIHFDIEQRISRAIRQGYLSRNPFYSNYASDQQKIYQMIKQRDYSFKSSELSVPSASGFTIIGFSGMGKTSIVERILKRYPQIILHEKYKDKDFDQKQLVWLKLDCSHDGSVKGLCRDFFIEFDTLMNDNTYNKFAAGRNTTTDTMIPRIAQIVRRHSLGLLVIDEIQHLSTAKSGGQEKMLNFFVNLVNTIGIPVILIGTPKALSILQGEFRQARRSSGQQGDLIIENMKYDDNWRLLVKGMWQYQWIKRTTELTQELQDVLYDQSQGIIDILIKLFIMVQIRAMATGKEIITAELIKNIADQNLKLVKPMIDALRSGRIKDISQYEDIKPIDIKKFCEEQLKKINVNEMMEQKRKERQQKQEDKDKLFNDAVLMMISLGIEPNMAQKAVRNTMNMIPKANVADLICKEAYKQLMKEEIIKEEKPVIKKIARKNPATDPDDLRVITAKGKEEKKSAYEALKESGVIKDPVEEFFDAG